MEWMNNNKSKPITGVLQFPFDVEWKGEKDEKVIDWLRADFLARLGAGVIMNGRLVKMDVVKVDSTTFTTCDEQPNQVKSFLLVNVEKACNEAWAIHFKDDPNVKSAKTHLMLIDPGLFREISKFK